MNMQTQDLEAMAERLRRLERQARRSRRIGVAVLVGIAAAVLMGQAKASKVAKVVEAEEFVLRDTAGKIRAELKTLAESDRNIVLLDFYDSRGTLLSRLGTGGFYLLDQEAKSRIVLNTSIPGGPTLMILGQDKKSGISLEAYPNGAAGLQLTDKDGNNVSLTTLSKLGAGLSISDKDNKARVDLLMGFDRSLSLSFSDKLGKERASLHVSAGGSPSLELSDKDGKARAVLGYAELEAIRTGTVEQRSESSLVLFDKNGKVIWQAP